MRVMQVIDSLNPGGAERLAVTYANNLVDKVDASFLCSTRQEGNLKTTIHNEVTYLFLERKSVLDINAIRVFIRFLKKHQIDIIHVHASSFFFVFIASLVAPKFIFIWHDHYGRNREELNKTSLYALKIASRKFDAIITVNETLQKWSKKTLFCSTVLYFKNFVDTKRKELAQTQLLGVAAKRIVCLANLRPQKDHLNLLKAFLKISHKTPEWTLHIVGKDFQDEYSHSIKEFIKNNELEEKIFIYGSKNDIFHILSQCDIGVLSSKSEGLPISLLEYGLAKLAVVCTNVGQCREVITTDELGVIIAPEQPEAIEKALDSLLKDAALRLDMGSALYDKINKEFGLENGLNQLINLYASIKKSS